MKLLKSLFIALTFSVLSFAGQMTIKTTAGDFKTNLATVDSIVYIKDVQPNTIDSLYIQLKGENLVTPMSTIPLRGIYSINFTPYQNSNDESITIHVGSGTLKGDYKILLNDIDSLDFPVIDDVNDADGDGLTDVYELFYSGTDPQLKDTDGDGINDKDDPNPTTPDVELNKNYVAGYNLYDSNDKKIGNAVVQEGITRIAIDYIPNAPIVVDVLTNEPVKTLTASLDGSLIDVTKINATTFRFKIPTLKTAGVDAVKLLITPESGKMGLNTIQFGAAMSFSSDLKLWPTEDINAIDVVFTPNKKDERIAGYAILRAKGSKGTGVNGTQNNKSLENLSLTTSEKPIEELVPEGVSVIKVIDKASLANYISTDDPTLAIYRDPVGPNSDYYSYRAVAYIKEKINGKDVYSYKMSDVLTRSTGKIRFYYKLIKFGTQYYKDGCQADMRIFADFYKSTQTQPEKNSLKYNYWFYNAGKDGKEGYIFWEDVADKSKSELNKVTMNQKVYYLDLKYNEDVDVVLINDADCTGVFKSIKETAKQTVTFKYSDILNAITALSLPEDDWEEYIFTYGKGGVRVTDPSNDNSSCSGCGGHPHAGWKFKLFFQWMESGN